ncbi:DUF5671 domain-containing protein [Roseobacter sp. HKCCA0434]|uniref:DUF5671 domain-containing protein n=1 Tax=Roseobacter sp. HKCCA0434 TaxID=3079297 RepID=UPI0029058DDA|nr:DUF5671 domain-containing protein [Roseobacter sp. HKCCA0434]
MAENRPIETYVEAGARAGLSHAQMRADLARAGWPEREIAGALAGWAEREGGAQGLPPIPRPRARFSFLDLLAYLLLLGAMAVTAFYLVSLTHGLLEVMFRDPFETVQGWRADSARWGLATLIVAALLYGVLTRWLDRRMRAAPYKWDSPVRVGALGLTILIAAIVLAGDAVVTIYALLSGDATVEFLLKALTVAVVAGGIVMVARDDLTAGHAARVKPVLHWIGALATIGLVAWTVMALGSPPQVRAGAQDEERLRDIGRIAEQLRCRATDEVLPETLSLSSASAYCRGSLVIDPDWRDPVTGEPYRYERVDDTRFRICADFADRQVDGRLSGANWVYDAGSGCVAGNSR